MVALQQAYQKVYSHASVIPGEVYLSSGFEDGRNIFCAFDENGSLQGYAPLFPNLTADPRLPHTIWAEIKADPESAQAQAVKDQLFEHVTGRVQELTQGCPHQHTRLTFQYHPTETASLEYVQSKGCMYAESVFRMLRELSNPIPELPNPDGIQVRPWRMQSQAEQQAYVQARNEAFPESPVSLADWQYFLASPAWQDGASITAFDGMEIAGSVAVYWDELLQAQAGRRAGYTEYIFVRPGWRKRGIAAYMICQALRYLKEHGQEAAFLEVKAANRRALELYLGLGYAVIDETQLFVREQKSYTL